MGRNQPMATRPCIRGRELPFKLLVPQQRGILEEEQPLS
jgi:hypothetical protein